MGAQVILSTDYELLTYRHTMLYVQFYSIPCHPFSALIVCDTYYGQALF
jgi:hypothetical protein